MSFIQELMYIEWNYHFFVSDVIILLICMSVFSDFYLLQHTVAEILWRSLADDAFPKDDGKVRTTQDHKGVLIWDLLLQYFFMRKYWLTACGSSVYSFAWLKFVEVC